jgi:hypothetical protein
MMDRIARVGLIGLELFLGVTAVYGAIWVVPTLPPEWLAGTPFSDYTVPALALGVVVGGGAFLAAGLLLFGEELGVLVSGAVGLAIAIFEVVETMVVGLEVWLHALGLGPAPTGPLAGVVGIPAPLWLQPFYFMLGVVIVALAARLWTRLEQPEPGYPAGV